MLTIFPKCLSKIGRSIHSDRQGVLRPHTFPWKRAAVALRHHFSLPRTGPIQTRLSQVENMFNLSICSVNLQFRTSVRQMLTHR